MPVRSTSRRPDEESSPGSAAAVVPDQRPSPQCGRRLNIVAQWLDQYSSVLVTLLTVTLAESLNTPQRMDRKAMPFNSGCTQQNAGEGTLVLPMRNPLRFAVIRFASRWHFDRFGLSIDCDSVGRMFCTFYAISHAGLNVPIGGSLCSEIMCLEEELQPVRSHTPSQSETPTEQSSNRNRKRRHDRHPLSAAAPKPGVSANKRVLLFLAGFAERLVPETSNRRAQI